MILRLILVPLIAFVLVAAQIPQPGLAFTLLNCSWGSSATQITYKWGPNLGSPTYTWRIKFNESISDWNTRVAAPKFAENAGSPNSLDSYTAADNNYGLFEYTCSGGWFNWFVAKANSYYGPSYNWDGNFMRSVTGHEMGHGFGLGHSSAYAIMNTSRDRYTLYVPQQDDLDGVAAIYPPRCPC